MFRAPPTVALRVHPLPAMGDASDEELLAAVRSALLRHVLVHRDCADTAEGVRWWLPAELVAAPQRIVLRALRGLVETRVMKEQTVTGGRSIFSVNTERGGE